MSMLWWIVLAAGFMVPGTRIFGFTGIRHGRTCALMFRTDVPASLLVIPAN